MRAQRFSTDIDILSPCHYQDHLGVQNIQCFSGTRNFRNPKPKSGHFGIERVPDPFQGIRTEGQLFLHLLPYNRTPFGVKRAWQHNTGSLTTAKSIETEQAYVIKLYLGRGPIQCNILSTYLHENSSSRNVTYGQLQLFRSNVVMGCIIFVSNRYIMPKNKTLTSCASRYDKGFRINNQEGIVSLHIIRQIGLIFYHEMYHFLLELLSHVFTTVMIRQGNLHITLRLVSPDTSCYSGCETTQLGGSPINMKP